MRSLLFAAILALVDGSSSAWAVERPVVVELFTSQGCSSCPPADRLLTELAQERSDVLPLAFHVTYWNSLGWHDPFSFEGATSRQNDYAAHFGSGSVFTPQLVIDGERSVVGSDRDKVAATIRSAGASRAQSVALRLRRNGARLGISVGKGAGRGRILLVGFDHQHRTPIGRGENGGRTLVESNIVRSLSTVSAWSGAPLNLAATTPFGEDAAVLIQAPDGAIIAAARLPF